MTDVQFVAVFGAIPATVTAFAGLIVSLKNSKKADQIHTLVNSNLDAVKDQLAAANTRIEVLSAAILKRTE